MRYRTTHEVTYCLVGQEDGPHMCGRLRNISLGGCSMIVPQNIGEGALLSIKVPGPGQRETNWLVAYVVHVTPLNDKRWKVGCTFAKEIGDDILTAWEISPQREKTTRANHLPWDRVDCSLEAEYQLTSEPDAHSYPTTIWNISSTGAGMLVQHHLHPGNLLVLDLYTVSSTFFRTLLSCVVHVSQQTEELWWVGCNFISELSEEEVAKLLST